MDLVEKKFVATVWGYYRKNARHTLPWRNVPAGRQGQRNPYRILVSEIMLQQTQVDRVIPKYESFLKRFPTVEKLSNASLGEVLREWQGLGYNRRAKMLHACAEQISRKHKGVFPKTHAELVKLPGVGNYTAGAIMAFAFNAGVPIIETNIRTVVIHHFFSDTTDVTDAEILDVVTRTLDNVNPREWYYALMDYGAYIKKEFGNPNGRSKHYVKQSTFKGSDRQIRGAILKLLSEKRRTRKMFHTALPFDAERIDAQLERLTEEGMIVHIKNTYTLP